MSLQSTVLAIKDLRIQGATAIARSALLALQESVHASKSTTPSALLKDVKKAETLLAKARPTEPYLRNMLTLAQHGIHTTDIRRTREDLHHNIQQLLKDIDRTKETIAHIGAKKLPKGARVFTHCHSSAVMSILKEAHKQKKRIRVLNTEARPKFQGRISAEELTKAGIPVDHYVDSAARIALKQADIMLIGADAITTDRIVNKIGSELFCEAAHRLQIPVYICTPALKFDPSSVYGMIEPMEERSPKEIWEKAPKHLRIHNPAFERVHPNLVQGIISELGIYPHDAFLGEVRRHYPQLFRK